MRIGDKIISSFKTKCKVGEIVDIRTDDNGYPIKPHPCVIIRESNVDEYIETHPDIAAMVERQLYNGEKFSRELMLQLRPYYYEVITD